MRQPGIGAAGIPTRAAGCFGPPIPRPVPFKRLALGIVRALLGIGGVLVVLGGAHPTPTQICGSLSAQIRVFQMARPRRDFWMLGGMFGDARGGGGGGQ